MFRMISRLLRPSQSSEVEPSRHYPSKPEAYADFVVDLVEASQSAERAMYVVAIENLKVNHQVLAEVAAKKGNTFDLDDSLNSLYQRMTEVDDPISSRRLLWFYMASHIMRLDRLSAQGADVLVDRSAHIWGMLANDSKLLKTLLPENAVWSTDEKEWFATCETEIDYIKYTLSFVMPKPYKYHDWAQAIAEERDFLLI